METSEDLAEAMVIMEQNMILGRGLRLDLNAIELLGPSHQDILGSLGAILKTRTDKGKQKRWNSTLSTDRQKNHELVMDIIANGGFIDVVDRNPARAKDNDPTAPGFSSSYFGDYMDKLRPVRPLFCISRRFAALCVGGNGDQGPSKLPGDIQEQLLPLGDWRDNDGRAPKDRNIIYTRHFNTKETSHIGTHVVWFDITTPMQKHHGWMDCANAVKLAEHARMTLHESLKQQIELMKVPRDVVSNMYKAFDREIARVKAKALAEEAGGQAREGRKRSKKARGRERVARWRQEEAEWREEENMWLVEEARLRDEEEEEERREDEEGGRRIALQHDNTSRNQTWTYNDEAYDDSTASHAMNTRVADNEFRYAHHRSLLCRCTNFFKSKLLHRTAIRTRQQQRALSACPTTRPHRPRLTLGPLRLPLQSKETDPGHVDNHDMAIRSVHRRLL
jgi:hypothetical protein